MATNSNGERSTVAVRATTVARAESHAPAIRRGLKSAGIITIAAALVGSIALPAAAFNSNSNDQYAADVALADEIAANIQTIEVAPSAALIDVGETGISATSPEELERLRAEAAAAEEQRKREREEAAAAAAQFRQQQAAAAPAAPAGAAAPAAAANPVATTGGVVGIAQSALGTPYSVMDCSAFTAWVYAHVGVSLPRQSTSQGAYGNAVDPSNLSSGDLLVWNGHTAIYVGNNTIIHSATSSSGVKYSSYSAMVGSMGQPKIRRF
ncbi:C40 family peptidase [Humidisolicoccus flavus]|uniref:C40 family peptidase n=1 Tax=Humidisolicoccus flavus TaxID=3111414 RepID=UPI003246585A